MVEKLILCDIHTKLSEAWRKYFDHPSVDIVTGSIFEQGADTIVAPGNCRAFMDGGLDMLISHFFNYTIEPRVQAVLYEKHGGQLPIGKAELVETEDARIPYLIYAPTMWRPQKIRGTNNVYLAMKATLECINANASKLNRIAIPGLGTGCGCMFPEDAAKQMWDAFAEVGLIKV